MDDIFEKYRSFYLPRSAAANIFTQVTGIAPFHHITLFQLITGATIIGIPTVDPVHPAGKLAAIKFVQIMDALNIGTVVDGRPGGLHVDTLFLAESLEDIKYRFALIESDCGFCQDYTVRRDTLQFIGVQHA